MNTAFNALLSLIPMRDLIHLHPEIIWHIITSYHKLQFLCLSWEVYFTPAFSPGQILKNDWKQRKSGLPEPLYDNVGKKKKKKDGGKKSQVIIGTQDLNINEFTTVKKINLLWQDTSYFDKYKTEAVMM